ncbi:hypothetical protein BGZ82_004643 [Podila clonocystis]|nr:hypothetical protein BGZ82_004643 [Podila clonocystis]
MRGCVHQGTLSVLKRSFRHLRELDLTFTETSPRISYSTLQTFFTKMSNLETLVIRVDLNLISPEMLWSLCHAQSVSKLAIRIHRTAHYTPEDRLPILDCCSHIPEVYLGTEFVRYNWGNTPNTRQVRQRRLLRFEFPPATPEKAMARVQRCGFLAASQQRVVRLLRLSTQPPPLTSNIRRLMIGTYRIIESDFLRVVAKCPQLEILEMQLSAAGHLAHSAWPILGHNCPKLHTLAVRVGDERVHLPHVHSLCAAIPSLERIACRASISLAFDLEPTIDFFCGRIQDPYRDPSTMDHIDITGDLPDLLKRFFEALARPGVQSITLGPCAIAKTSRPTDLCTISTMEPRCASTLVHLDISAFVFRDEAEYKSFWPLLTPLKSLKSLAISMAHLWRAMLLQKGVPWIDYKSAHGFFFPTVEILYVGRERDPHGVELWAAGQREIRSMRHFFHKLQQLVLWHAPAVGILEDCAGGSTRGLMVCYEKTV